MVANAFINIMLEHASFIIWEKLEFLLFNSWVFEALWVRGVLCQSMDGKL